MSSIKRHRRRHRNHEHGLRDRLETESLSKRERRGRLRFLFGILALAAAFAAVMLAVSLLEKAKDAGTEGKTSGAARSGNEEYYAADDEFGYGTRLWADMDTVDFEQGLYAFDHRMEAFLFCGTDDSGNEHPAEGEAYHGAMADFLLLMVLDYTDDTYGFLQIDRNTITPVGMTTEEGLYGGEEDLQICTAHWYGNNADECAENTVEAVSALLGWLENIHGYYILNMDDIGVLNSAVGGVEVTIEDDLSEADPELAKGTTLTLNDEQAERYFRARMYVGGGTNAERMARQRAYMDSFFGKVGDLTRKDANFYKKLWNDIHKYGDTNMNGNAFSRIANMLIKGENKGMLTLEGTTVEGYILGDGVLHEEFYPSEDAVFNVMNQLYPLIPIDYEDLEDYAGETEEDTEYYVGETEEDTEYYAGETEEETDL